MTLDASGNLVVADTTAAFTFAGRGNITIGGTTGSLLGFRVGAVNKGYVYHDGTDMFVSNDANGILGFYTNATERARIDSSGNMGIGTTSPGAKLDVRGSSSGISLYSSASTTSDFALALTTGAGNRMYLTTVGTTDETLKFINSSGSEMMRITNGGNLLVGTTSNANTAKIKLAWTSGNYGIESVASSDSTSYHIVFANASNAAAGNISTLNNTTTYATTSDYRLKTVIGAVTGHGARIDALEPVEYTWNYNGSRTRGFLAHKFQEVYADSVTGTKDAVDADGNPVYQAMQAGSAEVIADLVAEIQSLRKRLADAGI
jgi:hypothetical protein